MAHCRCRRHINKICLVCRKEFDVCNNRKDTAKYCSYKCGHKGTKNLKHESKRIETICNWCCKKFEVEPCRQATVGYCSKKCRAQHQRLLFSGENSWSWRGGRTSLARKLRTSFEYKEWRKAVFERDKYECVLCGNNTSGNLNADHIIRFVELLKKQDFKTMWSIENGRTLCVSCHKQTDTYGNWRIN